MVKIAFIFMAALATISPAVKAADCTEGIQYCGWTLLTYGDYDQRISAALGSPTPFEKQNSLFGCLGGGAIQYLTLCPYGCFDAGGGNSDFCRPHISSRSLGAKHVLTTFQNRDYAPSSTNPEYLTASVRSLYGDKHLAELYGGSQGRCKHSLHIQCILGNAHELSFNIVKVTAALMAALAAIAPVVEAGNCTPGLYYCGHTLMRYGDYDQRIINALGYDPGWFSNVKQKSLPMHRWGRW
ncbi:hypothetical protein E4U54_008246 [Claviceps lovelessii]|nr:hypothetical protein E4U54_008246 [Claviceps lovelessii]